VDLYEYQARDLFEAHGVPVPPGVVASTPAEAEAAARRLGGGLTVVKAQVKTGGRGKAGGVRLARTPAEAHSAAEAILGMDIKGHTVRRVLVASGVDVAREFYFSVLLDRAERRCLAMCSVEGGMEIEQLARERPQALARVPIDPLAGLDEAKAREIVRAAGFDPETGGKVAPVLLRLWDVYTGEDATLVEVNPLVLTERGEVLALDGKVTLDDNSRFRHPAPEAPPALVGRPLRDIAALAKTLAPRGDTGRLASGIKPSRSKRKVMVRVGSAKREAAGAEVKSLRRLAAPQASRDHSRHPERAVAPLSVVAAGLARRVEGPALDEQPGGLQDVVAPAGPPVGEAHAPSVLEGPGDGHDGVPGGDGGVDEARRRLLGGRGRQYLRHAGVRGRSEASPAPEARQEGAHQADVERGQRRDDGGLLGDAVGVVLDGDRIACLAEDRDVPLEGAPEGGGRVVVRVCGDVRAGLGPGHAGGAPDRGEEGELAFPARVSLGLVTHTSRVMELYP